MSSKDQPGPGSNLSDIAFIDLEASGLSARSWPIEVGWCFLEGEPQCHLIKPDGVWSLEDWSPAAEALHGIAHKELVRKGEDAAKLCNRLNEGLRGKTVYSDAPDWDGFWLYRLFQAGKARQAFELKDLNRLLHDAAPEAADKAIDAANAATPRMHRAAADVLHLRSLYLALSE